MFKKKRSELKGKKSVFLKLRGFYGFVFKREVLKKQQQQNPLLKNRLFLVTFFIAYTIKNICKNKAIANSEPAWQYSKLTCSKL